MSDGENIDESEGKKDDEDVPEETTSSPKPKLQVPSIRIPSAALPASDSARTRNHSSSEESGDEQGNTTNAWESPPSTARSRTKGAVGVLATPDVLLDRARKQARTLTKNGANDDAINERIKCLAYARMVHGDSHWQLAKAHAKLAEAYLDLKSLAPQAIKHSETAQDILLKAKENNAVNNTRNSTSEILPVMEMMYLVMGQAHGRMKRYQKAENFLKKANVISKQRVDLHQPGAVYTRLKVLNKLGKVQMKLNKFGNALEYFEKALAIGEEYHGNESEELIPILHDIGRAEQGQGDHANHNRALEMFEKGREIATKRYGEGSAEMADATMQLAVAYENTNKEENEEKAKDYLEYCIDVYEQSYGECSAKTLSAKDELCRLLLRQDKHNESVSLLKTIMKGKLQLYGDPSEQLAEAHRLLGSIKLSQGNLELALKHLRKSHEMLRCVLGNSHKKTKLISDTIEMIKKSPGASRFLTSEEKLKDRPRFSEVVGRSQPAGYSTAKYD